MSSIEQKYAKRWMTAQKNKQKIDNFNYQKHLLIHHHCQEVIENRADANAWKKKKIQYHSKTTCFTFQSERACELM